MMMMMVMMMMMNCFMVWLTNERCLVLFSARIIFKDPHHRESLAHYEQELNLCRMWVQALLNLKFCSRSCWTKLWSYVEWSKAFVFPDLEAPIINILSGWSGIGDQFGLCSFMFSLVISSKLIIFVLFILHCYILISSFLHTWSLIVQYAFFKLEFTPCKTEQPLQYMELREKETQKD